jgi:hypothetical protein
MTRTFEQRQTDNDTHVVSFYDRARKARLSAGTLSAGQAAKRDLARYHALLDATLPAIPAADAERLCRYLMTDPARSPLNAIAPGDWQWSDILKGAGLMDSPMGFMHPDRAQRLALLDAADRAIAAYETTHAHLDEIIPTVFRITPTSYAPKPLESWR